MAKRPGTIRVLPLKSRSYPDVDIDIAPISRDPDWRSLSPFNLGPCYTEQGVRFENMENLWQYSKVYASHCSEFAKPNLEWWKWHIHGSTNKRAERYPMGKGAIPMFSVHGALHLSYVAARKLIYIPQYSSLVQLEPKFRKLHRAYLKGANIVIRDYDAYDLEVEYRLATDSERILKCINNDRKKMGHGFVLAWSLAMHSEDPFWYKGLKI